LDQVPPSNQLKKLVRITEEKVEMRVEMEASKRMNYQVYH
jgi:hypothetical protein